MRRWQCVLALVLAAVLLVPLFPTRAGAAVTVYFTSVNDRLCELSDTTMPFWQNGVLYVAGDTLHDVEDLKLRYYYNREQSTAILYQGKTALYCDLTDGTMRNNRTGEYYSGSTIVRDGMVFFPVGVVASMFDLRYSCTRVTNGYLVRITNDDAILSDAIFIDAATTQLQQRYAQYERTHTVETPSGDTNSTAPSGTRTALTVYLLLPVADASGGMALLDALDAAGAHATLLLSPALIEEAGDLVRRAAATGNAIALRLDAVSAEDALAQAESANASLRRAACISTRLVHLTTADKTLRTALSDAGWCPVTVNASDFTHSGTHWAQTVLDYPTETGSLRLYLTTESAGATALSTMLSRLDAVDCTLASLSEVSA